MCRTPLRFLQLPFMPLEPYPARYARHLPHAGKALSVVILFPHMCVFALTLWGKRYSRIVAFPSRGRLTIRGKPAVKRPSGIAHLYSAALRSFDSVLPFQISHFFSAQDAEMRRTTTLNPEP